MTRTIAVASLIALCLAVPAGAASSGGKKPSNDAHRAAATHKVRNHPLLTWCISRQMHSSRHLSRFKAEQWCIAHHQY
jgi:hypothetical protein